MKELLCEKLPKLAIHFGKIVDSPNESIRRIKHIIFLVLESHGVDPALFSLNWFLCLFVEYLPVNTYLHIWDAFLFEGSKVSTHTKIINKSFLYIYLFSRFYFATLSQFLNVSRRNFFVKLTTCQYLIASEQNYNRSLT